MGDADFSWQIHALIEIDGPGMCDQQLMQCMYSLADLIMLSRGEKPGYILIDDQGYRVLHRNPMLYPAAKMLEANPGIMQELLYRIRSQPFSFFKYEQRRVEMVQCHIRLNPILQATIDDLTVKRQSGLIDLSLLVFDNPRPCDGDAQRFDIVLTAAGNIFFKMNIEFTRCLAIKCTARTIIPAVPFSRGPAVRICTPFDLIGRSCCAQYKVLRQFPYHRLSLLSTALIIERIAPALFSGFENVFTGKKNRKKEPVQNLDRLNCTISYIIRS